MGWTGGVAWAAHPAAEMLTGGSVTGTTYVGRHVAVLRATEKVGSGWVMDGAGRGAHDAVLHFFHFRDAWQMRKFERSILRRLLCV